MKTKCIIVDDEPLAINVIKNHLNSFEEIEIVAECENAIEAEKALRTNKIDLVFLDIEMPKISGFDFLASIKSNAKIIITTAYRNYALMGYDYDVVDYLLKPISFERFYQAINKFYKQINFSLIEIHEDTNSESSNQFIYLNADKTIHKIYLKDIDYIESFREYIKVHTTQKTVLTKLPISKIEEKLKDSNFVRVHKSFIVSLNKIDTFNSRVITIREIEIPIGRTYKEKIMQDLKFDPDML
jgi:DNA-binding LytR/AlgR family response regulator